MINQLGDTGTMLRAERSERFREGEPPCEPSADAGSDGGSPSRHRRHGPHRGRCQTPSGPFIFGLLCLLAVPAVGSGDESAAFQKLGEAFGREIRPILDQHCMKCHAADVQEGTLDLEQFAKLDDVRRVTVTLSADGGIYLDGNPTTAGDLPDQLRNLNAQSKVAVIIAGDERSQLQLLVDVLGALQRSGIAATSITTKAK